MTERQLPQVTDAEALRALAHPLRMRILGSLRVDGPATSAVLARRLGTDSGQTSHHLRLLDRYGFIEEAPELGKGSRGRERWWKATQSTTVWSSNPDDLGPDGAEVVSALDRTIRQVWEQIIESYRAQVARREWSAAWQQAAGYGDVVIRTTPERLAAMRAELKKVAESYDLGDQAVPDAESVAIVLQAYPYRTDQ
ncbi:winged helix-turn-helix domain-containing protein [Mangrovihabitans endophyticus]|uniref:HTH arsR-type domain-containing protein n=1 Tax=Mangrovihabitans endophyticus TaxID=1751298 RepID=A0A8J3FN31_9ACTN|nr:helix-turn-helix domain-containing protein [Mangrovihabitans endophyticus]GGK78084.1 hypothetical protein GCM10012284_10000 [Mangrovihabitans endophyticus]